MDANHHEQPRTLNCAALRTLHVFQLTLRRQINDLMAIECEDPEAADPIKFAVASAKQALERARVARRKILKGE